MSAPGATHNPLSTMLDGHDSRVTRVSGYDESTFDSDGLSIDGASHWAETCRSMKVHVVWSPIEQSNTFRSNAGLVALISPDGQRVLFIELQAQRVTLRPELRRLERPRLERFLAETGIQPNQLRTLIGELHLPGGQELSPLLLRDVLNVLLLSEEPPGNDPVPGDLPLPLDSVNVISQGTHWPGYERASLEPDGDVLVNHVILASVLPPAPA